MATRRDILAQTQSKASEQKKNSPPRSVCIAPADFSASKRGNAAGTNCTPPRSDITGCSIPLSALGRIPPPSTHPRDTDGGTDPTLHLRSNRNSGDRMDCRETPRRETCTADLSPKNAPNGAATVNLTWIPFSQTNQPNKNYEQQKQKTYITFHGFVEETRKPCLCFNAWRPCKTSIDALGRPRYAEWNWQTAGVILYAELRLPY